MARVGSRNSGGSPGRPNGRREWGSAGSDPDRYFAPDREHHVARVTGRLRSDYTRHTWNSRGRRNER